MNAVFLSGHWFWMTPETWTKCFGQQVRNERIRMLHKRGTSISILAHNFGMEKHQVKWIVERMKKCGKINVSVK